MGGARRYVRRNGTRAKTLTLVTDPSGTQRLLDIEYLDGHVQSRHTVLHSADVRRRGRVLPLTRAECEDGERPCPFVSCKHHLYLDVNPETGSIKLNFPHLEPWEMAESCSLDVAERGGITLEEVGAIVNLTRERVRQVEVRATTKLRLLRALSEPKEG